MNNNKKIDTTQKSLWKEGAIFRDYTHPIIKYFIQQRIHFIKKYIPFSAIHSTLDIGYGNGATAHYLSKLIPFAVAGDYAIDW